MTCLSISKPHAPLHFCCAQIQQMAPEVFPIEIVRILTAFLILVFLITERFNLLCCHILDSRQGVRQGYFERYNALTCAQYSLFISSTFLTDYVTCQKLYSTLSSFIVFLQPSAHGISMFWIPLS